MEKRAITRNEFEKEIVKLLLRGPVDMPRSPRSQQILLKSVMLHLGAPDSLSERELNERLRAWAVAVADGNAPDPATLRRGLVDGGFLNRSSDGASYEVNPAGPRAWYFAPEVDRVDVPALLAEARAEVERRRRAHAGR